MPRVTRQTPGGIAYHVMNRASGRLDLFQDAGDYEAFERVLSQAIAREPAVRVCGYCLMPNHFHLVLWPSADDRLSRFMQWLTMTHTQRWHAHRHSTGRGHLYQSRFKHFAIQRNWHFLSVLRYVERNPLRANLVRRAEDWRWSSLRARREPGHPLGPSLSRWPVPEPADWLEQVNRPQDEQELAALRRARDRGRPYGDDAWTKKTALKTGVEHALRPRGRPRKAAAAEK